MEFKYKEFTFKTGDKVISKIRGIDIFDAVINLEEYRGYGDRIYICHNERDAAGSNCYQKYGYAYSYCLRGSGSINGFYQTLSDNVENLTPSIGDRRDFNIFKWF